MKIRSTPTLTAPERKANLLDSIDRISRHITLENSLNHGYSFYILDTGEFDYISHDDFRRSTHDELEYFAQEVFGDKEHHLIFEPSKGFNPERLAFILKSDLLYAILQHSEYLYDDLSHPQLSMSANMITTYLDCSMHQHFFENIINISAREYFNDYNIDPFYRDAVSSYGQLHAMCIHEVRHFKVFQHPDTQKWYRVDKDSFYIFIADLWYKYCRQAKFKSKITPLVGLKG